jgi:hypothetical protein
VSSAPPSKTPTLITDFFFEGKTLGAFQGVLDLIGEIHILPNGGNALSGLNLFIRSISS